MTSPIEAAGKAHQTKGKGSVFGHRMPIANSRQSVFEHGESQHCVGGIYFGSQAETGAA